MRLEGLLVIFSEMLILYCILLLGNEDPCAFYICGFVAFSWGFYMGIQIIEELILFSIECLWKDIADRRGLLMIFHVITVLVIYISCIRNDVKTAWKWAPVISAFYTLIVSRKLLQYSAKRDGIWNTIAQIVLIVATAFASILAIYYEVNCISEILTLCTGVLGLFSAIGFGIEEKVKMWGQTDAISVFLAFSLTMIIMFVSERCNLHQPFFMACSNKNTEPSLL